VDPTAKVVQSGLVVSTGGTHLIDSMLVDTDTNFVGSRICHLYGYRCPPNRHRLRRPLARNPPAHSVEGRWASRPHFSVKRRLEQRSCRGGPSHMVRIIS
jgi:hypothetical protein